MKIYELPNEIKEKILLEVYERQCYDVVISGDPTRKLIEMLWVYKNDMARSIVWKWLVWWCHRTLLPENMEFIKDHIYERFRKMIQRSYNNLFVEKNESFPHVNELCQWYHIEPEINTFLKTFMNSKNKKQIEKHILRFHEGTGGQSFHEKNILISSFCNKFTRSFLPELCRICGKDPPSSKDVVTYPCKHKICKNCFLFLVSTFDRSCHIYNLEKKQVCNGELKQKGWNYYLLKHYQHKKDYIKCKRCGYYKDFTYFKDSTRFCHDCCL